MEIHKNGDEMLDECLFCMVAFDETQKLGSRIFCDPEEGGCGATYKLVMLPNKKAKDAE